MSEQQNGSPLQRPAWRWMVELGALAFVIGLIPLVVDTGDPTVWLVGVGALFLVSGLIVRAIETRPGRD